MKKIILTGGGTAGHVTPNLALVPKLKEAGFDICYVGSYNGMEKGLVQKANLPYKGISSGKLRRYFDWKNFTDPFRVLKGFSEAKKIMKEYRPDVVFSKGGFVSVPVVFAAKHYKIPVVSHESDMTPGLANKLTLSSCTKICCNFPETVKSLPADKAVVTGCPIREELLTGSREEGLKLTGFHSDKPVLLIIGGSLGSVKVNQAVRSILPKLTKDYQVVHLCGKGNLDETLTTMPGYVQYEYMSEPLRHLFAMADVVISRAGANAICELLALKKPALLIPLSAQASRGDQILNANSFKKQGFSAVLEEEELSDERLYDEVTKLYKNRKTYIENMTKSNQSDAVSKIVDMLSDLAGKR
ncbi:UDP-N-acetylglucosamine--N-acetylmuramyl- (pentapeptide) pyrophosphoryl-undecaprenol N-acetylglucosamine transferase [Lachnospiraceae bacterium TWA4]|nr:UDP-N-acetylglucosamine--N-acetylmuramyl- (pentapeptide) pyrophosphoryl-undecaprenol N-acetylglucosamine transferase [Lachnospiraceae bacterium TWA4]